jgi:hypothetical protein
VFRAPGSVLTPEQGGTSLGGPNLRLWPDFGVVLLFVCLGWRCRRPWRVPGAGVDFRGGVTVSMDIGHLDFGLKTWTSAFGLLDF